MLESVKRLIETIDQKRTLGVAAEMAFWMFSSILPILVLVGLATSYIATTHSELLTSLFAEVPKHIQTLILDELKHIDMWNGGVIAPTATVIFLWLASSGIHSVFNGFETQLHFERSWWIKRCKALATCLVLSVYAVLLVILSSAFQNILARVFGNDSITQLWLSGWMLPVRVGLSCLIVFILTASLYIVGIPRSVRKTMPLLPGCAVVVVLFVLLSKLYTVYLDNVGDGSVYQAGLAAIAITMFTLYLFCVSLLIGIVVNQHLAHHVHSRTMI